MSPGALLFLECPCCPQCLGSDVGSSAPSASPIACSQCNVSFYFFTGTTLVDKDWWMLPSTANYYRMRVSDILASDLRAVFDELVHIGGFEPSANFELEAWKWCAWFFGQTSLRLTTNHVVWPGSPLGQAVGKLRGTEVFRFCEHIAAERRLGSLEPIETAKLLTFLKRQFARAKR